MTSRKANLEFQVAFSETNLRYLHGEPSSPERDRAIAMNETAIREASQELAEQEAKPATSWNYLGW